MIIYNSQFNISALYLYLAQSTRTVLSPSLTASLHSTSKGMIQSILIVQKFFYSILNNLEGYTTYNSTFLQFIGQYCCGLWMARCNREILFPCGLKIVRMIMWVTAHKVTQDRPMTLISPWLRAVSWAGPLYMSPGGMAASSQDNALSWPALT